MSAHFAKTIQYASIAAFAICAVAATAGPIPGPHPAALAVPGLHAASSAAPAHVDRSASTKRALWAGGLIEALHAPVPVDVPAGDGTGRQTFEILTASGYPDDANPYPDSPYSGIMPSTNYGYSMALDGDRLFVGSLIEFATRVPDTFGTGGVYCYKKIDGHWQLMQKLLGDDSVDEDEFGVSVAVSGDTLMVGAQMAAVDGNAIQGAAYVFHFDDASGLWMQTQKLTADDGQEFEAFGHMIALQDGNALIDSVQGIVDGNFAQGSVYAFTESNGVWNHTGKVVADTSNTTDITFYGWSIALQGTTALIGTPFANSLPNGGGQGLVEAYDYSTGSWLRTQVLTPCGDAGQYPGFGWSMALQGSKVVIGAPVGGGEMPGATGAACIYESTGGDWSLASILTASDAVAYEAFGISVALKDDVIAVGASPNVNAGISYVFENGVQTDEFAQTSDQGIAIDGSAIIGTYSSVNIADFVPQADVAPAALSFALQPGAADSTAVSVANFGSGAVLGFNVGDDGTELSQTASAVSARGIGYTCAFENGDTAVDVRPRGTSDTSWWRRFYFDELPQVGASASVNAVTVGIDVAPAGAEYTINLYAMPHDVAFDTIDDTQLTLVGTATATAAGTDVPQSVDVPVTGTIDDTVANDLVVEYRVSADDSLIDTLPLFIASANLSPQTHPTFVSSPTVCGLYIGPHPIPFGSFGNVLMSVHLDPAAPSDRCANPITAPWLSVPTGAGVAEAGSFENVSVDVDTTGLADGDYSATLCVKTSDTQRPFALVPVTLSVGDNGGSGGTIFRNGFDGTP